MEVGPYAPHFVIAHEFGHAVQNQLGFTHQLYPTILLELQADCFGGVYTRDALSRNILEGQLHYVAFDPLWLNGRDLRQLPLTQRKKRLGRLLPVSTGTLSTALTVEEHGRELFEAACQLDFEGIVAKRKADLYDQRVRWWKVKNPTYTKAEGRRELFERRR